MAGFFSRFYYWGSLTINVKLSASKLCLRDDFEINTIRIRLIDKSCLPFKVFNAADNLKVTRATQSSLSLSKSFTELKSGSRS